VSRTDVISYSNAVANGSKPSLSVLIPFYRDDPSELISALAEAGNISAEVLLYDDGNQDEVLTQNIQRAADNAKCSVTLITAHENKGRSFGRNYLFNAARADWVLFLDADMHPLTHDFLKNYIDIIKTDQADIIFGGFQVQVKRGPAATEIHRKMSLLSDCESAAKRQSLGPKNVASSNLCVKKNVLIQEPFDDEFTGWGWEDSEWAARAAKTYRLIHIDNPALHLGLESTNTLLSRFKTSGHNYARFTEKHPEIAKSLPLYRWTMTLKKWPLHKALRPVLRAIVKFQFMPMGLRIRALKLWRASWYTEAM